jgi:hypothetical protein
LPSWPCLLTNGKSWGVGRNKARPLQKPPEMTNSKFIILTAALNPSPRPSGAPLMFNPSRSRILLQNAMRFARRVAVPGIVLFAIVAFFWTYPLQLHRPASVQRHGQSEGLPNAEDKVVVIAKMESENTDWVIENLPEYCPI